MRISDWSSDVCSSDLLRTARRDTAHADVAKAGHGGRAHRTTVVRDRRRISWRGCGRAACSVMCDRQCFDAGGGSVCFAAHRAFDQPGAEQWRYPEVRFELGAEVQTGLCIAALQLPVGLAIAQVAQCWNHEGIKLIAFSGVRITHVLDLLEVGAEEADADTYAGAPARDRSEEHTSELQSLMRISYAVFCLKKKKKNNTKQNNNYRYNQNTKTTSN